MIATLTTFVFSIFLTTSSLLGKKNILHQVWKLRSGFCSKLQEYHDYKAQGRLVPDGTNVRWLSSRGPLWRLIGRENAWVLTTQRRADDDDAPTWGGDKKEGGGVANRELGWDGSLCEVMGRKMLKWQWRSCSYSRLAILPPIFFLLVCVL